MTESRRREIISNLQSIIDSVEPEEDKEGLTMFDLISRYNQQYDNFELIGGSWAKENGFYLPS